MEPAPGDPRTGKAKAMQTLLIVFEIMIAIALVIVILLQRSEGGVFGMGGGGSGLGGLFSPRGAADTLTRTTTILAALFFLICIGLNLIALRGHNERSILDSPATTSTPLAPAPKPGSRPAGPPVPSVPVPH